MKIKVKKLHEDAITPRFAHATDTGFDLFTVEDTTIKQGETKVVRTGLAMELPPGWGIAIRNKSGITVKGAPVYSNVLNTRNDGSYKVSNVLEGKRAGITVFLGTIDNSYRGEIGIMVRNESMECITIPKHTKLAQGVLEKVYQCDFVMTEELSQTERGTGGYGSTGVGVE